MAAVDCNPLEVSSCASAMTTSNPPTAVCCSKLKEQKPCLCQYVKDPNLQKLVNSPNAKKMRDRESAREQEEREQGNKNGSRRQDREKTCKGTKIDMAKCGWL
ncbi:Non-specific lipid-transfer protein 2 [Quillaja saponaria]|uniref:Non-specific lipid-transfer protein 2 n=1 Tax=Quillaja saponaria TaxID=32244 RepID=A0AAD7KPZ7_QUISA|nr:Non-specific lipid-transfer protein 2 [Quillaja saponaria]